MDRQAFETALREDGFGEPVVVEWRAHEEHADHPHDFDVRALVLRGRVAIRCDGGRIEYGPGDSFAMPRGKLHGESAGPDGAALLVGRR